jgi:hypothetical protein
MEWQLHFVECISRAVFGGGGCKAWPNGTSGLNLVNSPGQKNQTYHHQPLGGWALAELAGGWKDGSTLWPPKFDKN